MKRAMVKPASTLALLLSLLPAAHAVGAAEVDTWAQSMELETQGKYKEAAALVEPLLDGGGDSAEFASLRYGWLNYLLRNHNDAIRSYQKALRLNPESVDAHLGLTLPMVALHRWPEAARHAGHVLQRCPGNFVAHQRLLEAEEGQRQWSKMKKHASELAVKYPASPIPWLYLARAEAWLGDYQAAKRAYKRVIRRSPGNLEANAFVNRKTGGNSD